MVELIENEIWIDNKYYLQYSLDIDQIDNMDDFYVRCFAKERISENDIYPIRLERRIGWLIPLVALNSAEHDYSKNKHFLPFSLNAILNLVANKSNVLPIFPALQNGQPCKVMIDDLFEENLVVLILYKNWLTDKFKIDKYLPFFYKYGYSYCDNGCSTGRPNCILEIPTTPNHEVKLEPISKKLTNNVFIQNFVIEYQLLKHELLKFTYLYQVIEFFIELEFNEKAKHFFDYLNNTNDFRLAKERFYEISSEKKLINILFSKIANMDEKEDLQNACEAFLESKEENLINSLYSVRCKLVHDYRNCIDKLQKLKDVNDNFMDVIIEILLKYPSEEIKQPLQPESKPCHGSC